MALVGGEGAEAARMVDVDFGRASINAITAMFPEARVAGCYFYLGKSVYREVQRLGLQGGSTKRTKISASESRCFPPFPSLPQGGEGGDIDRTFEDLSPQLR